MSAIKIIGVGSPIGNDGVGLIVIDRLQQTALHTQYPNHQITLEKLDRPGPALLGHMRGADIAIIIDALVSDHEPGSVVPLRPDEIAQEEWVLSGHGLGVAETIALGNVLGELPERLLLLGIAVGQLCDLSSDADINPETLGRIQGYIGQELG